MIPFRAAPPARGAALCGRQCAANSRYHTKRTHCVIRLLQAAIRPSTPIRHGDSMSETKEKPPTGALWDRLFKAPTLEGFMAGNESAIGLEPFCVFISRLCTQMGEVPERIIKRADIERSFGHQIFRGSRRPSRDTVLQLAFGFGADIDLTQELLRHSGHSPLYPRVKRDVAISYCLHHRTGLIEAQNVLVELGLPLIGGRSAT